jgi:hypothetical protein
MRPGYFYCIHCSLSSSYKISHHFCTWDQGSYFLGYFDFKRVVKAINDSPLIVFVYSVAPVDGCAPESLGHSRVYNQCTHFHRHPKFANLGHHRRKYPLLRLKALILKQHASVYWRRISYDILVNGCLALLYAGSS